MFSVGGGPGGNGGRTLAGGGGPGGGAGIFAGDPGFVGEVGADMVSACQCECLLFSGAAMALRSVAVVYATRQCCAHGSCARTRRLPSNSTEPKSPSVQVRH